MVRNNPSYPPQDPIRLAEVLAALSLATDLGAGKPMGHALRACYLGLQLAGKMGIPPAQQAELYFSFFLMHSGCTVLSLGMTPEIQGDELAAIGDITLRDDTDLWVMLDWMRRNVSPGAPLPQRIRSTIGMLLHNRDTQEHVRGACEVAFQVAQRLGLPPGVQEAVRHYLERWDGKGPFGLAGNAIPLNARLLHTALKIEAVYTVLGRDQAEAMAREQKGKTFDPQITAAFLELAGHTDLWDILEKDDLWEIVLNLEPDSPYRELDEAELDVVAYAVADFVDLKSFGTLNHSRETARIAEGMARRMGLSPSKVASIRRAALVHDLGQVALPGLILQNRDRLSAADREKLRLHPYYTERVLARVPALAEVAAIAGRHHERMDGSGYYRGLSGSDLPVSACIVALADEFQERLQPQPGQPAPDPAQILNELRPEIGTLFSPQCFEALASEQGLAMPEPPRRHTWPAGLTDREVEVVRLVATGATNRQIASELVVSEKTVAHHLEHIYNKIGVSSRAAAVFFAMEHELIS